VRETGERNVLLDERKLLKEDTSIQRALSELQQLKLEFNVVPTARELSEWSKRLPPFKHTYLLTVQNLTPQKHRYCAVIAMCLLDNTQQAVKALQFI